MKTIRLGILVIFLCTNLLIQGQNPGSSIHKTKNFNPKVAAIIQEINKDSIAANIRKLAGLGTRYEFAPNRRVVAEFIRQRFISYGYPDAVLDSFRLVSTDPPYDFTWQYNVMATLSGNSAPKEVYIMCAHHDSYASPDPLLLAPGADDDASGTAAVLEFARILKKTSFAPHATIRFLTIAAEELMGYTQYSGAFFYAEKAVLNHEDIRLLTDLDVIAYNTPGDSLTRIPFSRGEISDWTYALTASALANYSSMQPYSVQGPSANAEPFFRAGYAYSFFYEYDFNPNMHSIHDILDSCDMNYCTEIVKAACGTVLTEQFTPVPQGVECRSGKDQVTISWRSTANSNLAGYNVYRSEDTTGTFIKMNSALLTDTTYDDFTLENGKLYYYQITSMDKDDLQSTPSNTIKTCLFPKDKELLVVKDSKGGLNNPSDESVIGFYQYLFSSLEYDFINASDTDSISVSLLGRYRNLVWLSNAFSNLPSAFINHRSDVRTFLDNGGNLLMANFQISYLVEGNLLLKQTFAPGSDMYDTYKISAVDRQLFGMFNGAWPVAQGYDSIYVDSAKAMTSIPRHIRNLETFTPAPGGVVIYLFDSEFDTTENYGKMKGKPVGVEYMGNDYKVITLSAPLYYLDSMQAKRLVEFIVNEKFKPGVGVPENQKFSSENITLYQNYPNPVRGETVIRYSLKESMDLTLEIRDIYGRRIMETPAVWHASGSYERRLNLDGIPVGLYFYILRSEKESVTGKMILMN